MSAFSRIILFFVAIAANCINASAQDYTVQWHYEAGNYFGSLSMSANAQYLAAQVYVLPNNDPNQVYHEVHLLNATGNCIWKYKWDQQDWLIWGVSVSNHGDVAVLSSAEPFNMALRGKENPVVVTRIDRNGKVLVRKGFGSKPTMFSGVSISSDGNYIFLTLDGGTSLLLLDRAGNKSWSEHVGDGDFNSPAIAGDGNLLFYNSNTHQVHVWNGQESRWWTAECPYDGRCRISPKGQWVAVLLKDALSDLISNCETAGDIALYDCRGKLAKRAKRICTTPDFAVTDNQIVIAINDDKLSDNLFVQMFDFNKPVVKMENVYQFAAPSGKHGGGAPSLEASGDGEVIALSTPYSIYYLKASRLERNW